MELPENCIGVPALRELTLGLKCLSRPLEGLTNLASLELLANYSGCLPPGFGVLSLLQAIKFVKLESLPEDIGRLGALR